MQSEDVKKQPLRGDECENRSDFEPILQPQNIYYSLLSLKASIESVMPSVRKNTNDDDEKDPTSASTSKKPEFDNTYQDPSILKHTKMKWLTEEKEGGVDSRSPPLSASLSTTSSCSLDDEKLRLDDRCLSKIIQLDKEYNLFGISNIITEVDPTFVKKKVHKSECPVFPQNAIVQICCDNGCCKYKSNTNMPTSLTCGGCRSCCGMYRDCRSICRPISPLPCGTAPPMIIGNKCSDTCYGFTMTVKNVPEVEEEPKILYPKCRSNLVKPLSARPCEHNPRCTPPSPCFPFLMPCFWPPPKDSPCSAEVCFHKPACKSTKKPPRKPPKTCLCRKAVCGSKSGSSSKSKRRGSSEAKAAKTSEQKLHRKQSGLEHAQKSDSRVSNKSATSVSNKSDTRISQKSEQQKSPKSQQEISPTSQQAVSKQSLEPESGSSQQPLKSQQTVPRHSQQSVPRHSQQAEPLDSQYPESRRFLQPLPRHSRQRFSRQSLQPASQNPQQPESPNSQQPESLNSQQPESPNSQQPASQNPQQPEPPNSQQPASQNTQPESPNSQQPESPNSQEPASQNPQQSESPNSQQPESLNSQQRVNITKSPITAQNTQVIQSPQLSHRHNQQTAHVHRCCQSLYC